MKIVKAISIIVVLIVGLNISFLVFNTFNAWLGLLIGAGALISVALLLVKFFNIKI